MSMIGMKCPSCGSRKNNVKDSRPYGEDTIRRRRNCLDCGARFGSYEVGDDAYRLLDGTAISDTLRDVVAPA
jgi:transcriptional regulator NrdR family protein